ncbi:protein S100-B-like [Nematolebias whitei]|uniref:protein S100-B-like n=1 Tax=Nematolebias whitei TaxID=451745 RepID=UPI00189A40BB|nr:protein S100-B-like [Nematolebias whitei]
MWLINTAVIWVRSKTHGCSFFSLTQDSNRTEEQRQMEASKDAMSDLESSMATIVQVFHKYSGHKCKLKKTELKALINNEMNHFIMKIHENETLDQLFADLDQNGDLEIDFQEFVTLIAMVTSACHEFFTPSFHDQIN